MYKAYVIIGVFETELEAIEAVATAEQLGDSTLIKKIKE
tara:strand:- start:58 stop:174 length:117 start_codon:yes stop_codon:yes gene_type:complete